MDLPVDRQARTVALLYAAAEERLRRLVLEALASGQLGTARYRAVRLAAIQQELAAVQAQAVPEATQVLASAYRLGVDIGGGISGAFGTGIHADAVAILADNLVRRLNDAAEHVGRQADDVFRQEGLRLSAMHLLEGSTRREASRQLQESLAGQGIKSFTDRAGREWNLGSYTEMVIRTTTREAVSVATRNRMLEGGNDLVTISHHDHEPDVCSKFDNQTFSITGTTDGYPVLEEWPPFHPRAVPAGSVVTATDVHGAVRADWDGPLVHATTDSGVRLSVSPNHPVLTARIGWAPAKALRVGDYVIRQAGRERVGATSGPSRSLHRLLGSDHCLDYGPSLIEDVFDALASTGLAASVPRSARYLHGDGRFCQSEIDVIRANGALWDDFDSAFCKPSCHGSLVTTVKRPLMLTGRGGLHQHVVRGRCDVLRSLSYDDSERVESPEKGGSGKWPTFGEVLNRLAGSVTTGEIVEVSYEDRWRGQVFDLETGSGAYFSNGVYVHNCRHVATPASANLDQLERDLGLVAA